MFCTFFNGLIEENPCCFHKGDHCMLTIWLARTVQAVASQSLQILRDRIHKTKYLDPCIATKVIDSSCLNHYIVKDKIHNFNVKR